jgi:hypothetical protein
MLEAMTDLSSKPWVAVALMDVDVRRKCQLRRESIFLLPSESLLWIDCRAWNSLFDQSFSRTSGIPLDLPAANLPNRVLTVAPPRAVACPWSGAKRPCKGMKSLKNRQSFGTDPIIGKLGKNSLDRV